ncbi:hypothetical protein GYMLUDRAFT_992573 [Collybiopsis luxurians FD-317 M1]|nr:hypothetical protein GYMLUDRAFT_992573 [Collybiopsis luxurians FD-317 M1]
MGFQECQIGTLCVSRCMEIIYEELRLCKELWLPRPAVRAKSTRKIIYNALWCLRPPRNNCRKHIVMTFSKWDAVETVTHAVCAPARHNPSSKSLL